MTTAPVTPFTISIDGADLTDLRARLRRTRWPDRETVGDWSQGTPLAYLQAVCARPVRVAMDEARDAVAPKRLAHRRIVDIHDLGGLRLDDLLALLAQPAHRRATLGERLGEEFALPVRRAR